MIRKVRDISGCAAVTRKASSRGLRGLRGRAFHLNHTRGISSHKADLLARTRAFLGTQAPFRVAARHVHITSEYVGSESGDLTVSVTKHSPDRTVCRQDLAVTSSVGILRLARLASLGSVSGIWVIISDGQPVGYRTFSMRQDAGLMEVKLENVVVVTAMRGRGLRDAMDTAILSAALMACRRIGVDLQLTFMQVKNPNNRQRYRTAGMETIETHYDDAEDEPTDDIVAYIPRDSAPSRSVIVEPSYRTFYRLQDYLEFLRSP